MSAPYPTGRRFSIWRVTGRRSGTKPPGCWSGAALARFFLRVGRPREAYQEYSNAAEVCALCYDGLWVQGERCDVPMKPLYKRFHAMHSRCLELAEKHPVLRKCYEGSSLQDHFLWFTLDEREDRRELREARESSRSWRFGKTA